MVDLEYKLFRKEVREVGLFKKKVETRADESAIPENVIDPVLRTMIENTIIDKSKALNIPTVAGCAELISNIIASTPIKLFKDVGGGIEEITEKEDIRLKLLNDETGDLLDAYQMKKAMIKDYLLAGNGYIYINKKGNTVKSLHYVDEKEVNVINDVDPIFKKVKITVHGQRYYDFDFIKVTRNTKNGVTGTGIIQENPRVLSVAYNSLIYEENLVKTGGNKKGFLKSENRLEGKIIEELKAAWKRLYANNEENVVVLNKGLEFQEASNTSVEMQLNENKKTNAEELCKLFTMSIKVLDGTASEEEQINFIKNAIVPIYKAFITALNKDLLLETEKGSYYFDFDYKEFLKGDIEKLYRAYKTAIEANFMQIDEVRYEIDREPLGFNYMKLGLQDVLLEPKTGQIYTPNMDATANLNNMSHMKGGGKDENGD